MTISTELLLPRPREARTTREILRLGQHPTILLGRGAEELEVAVEFLVHGLEKHGTPPRLTYEGDRVDPKATPIRLQLQAVGLGRESYELRIDGLGIHLTAADPAGALYGVATLRQWIDLHDFDPGSSHQALQGLEVADSPVLRSRGVLLDISRDRVPTLGYAKRLVDQLALWKFNELQLYMEHTFAYSDHPDVWKEASAWEPGEIRALDLYCRERGIELVPNQNSLGHFHRWLSHPDYRFLAEVPEGVRHPFGDEIEPFSLCPTDPRVPAFLDRLYAQLLPCFSSRRFNVGLDEPFDIGRGRSREECDARGRGAVLLDYVRQIHALVQDRGIRMEMWADILLEHPEIAGDLPRDVIPLVWGYEADHPFEDEARKVAANGHSFLLCPGTSSWNSLAGRLGVAAANIDRASRAAAREGAAGLLVTDWGDFGHLQPPSVAWPGLYFAAVAAWNPGTLPDDPEVLRRALDVHVYRDRSATQGAAAWALGTLHERFDPSPKNTTVPFLFLLRPEIDLDDDRLRGLTPEALERTFEAIEAGRAGISMNLDRIDADLIVAETRWTADLLELCTRLAYERHSRRAAAAALPAAVRGELTAALEPLIERHRQLWEARSRPGGRTASVARLHHLRAALDGSRGS